MAIYWEPLTADRVSLCAPLWSDRAAYTRAELRAALARLERLLDERRANGAVICEDERARAFGVTVFARGPSSIDCCPRRIRSSASACCSTTSRGTVLIPFSTGPG